VKINDANSLTEIYNHYIQTSGVTFEEKEITDEVMKSRIQDIHFERSFPYIIFEDGGETLGYAYGTTFRERNAYRYTVESTVYVHPDHFGKGIGKALYTKLIEQIKDGGFRSIIGVITLPNDASVNLHEQLGFVKAGELKEAGYKFEEWMDVGLWELRLATKK